MWQILSKGVIAGIVVVTVAVISKQSPKLGALLLTLPLVSIMAFITVWNTGEDLARVSQLARDTLILVPLGLPFFVPLAFANKLGLGFWPAFVAGIVLASTTIGLWFWLGPKSV